MFDRIDRMIRIPQKKTSCKSCKSCLKKHSPPLVDTHAGASGGCSASISAVITAEKAGGEVA